MHTDYFAILADNLASESQYDEEFTTTANVVTAVCLLGKSWISSAACVLAVKGGSDSSCEIFMGKQLSAWQITKKALWDRVRGASLEISMQQGPLLQMSLELEEMPGAPAECPLGVLAIQLFLLDMLRALPQHSQQAETAAWLEKLIREAIFLRNWSDIISSGWPIFGLLARLSMLGTPGQTDTDVWHKLIARKLVAPSVDQLQENIQDIVNLELAAADQPSRSLFSNFFNPGSTSLWTDLSSRSQEYIFQEAILGGGSQAPAFAAYYFLKNLRTEFAGFSGPVDPFLHQVLANLKSADFNCWDVGAAPVPKSNNPDEPSDVWQICSDFGLKTRAFEPSKSGYGRLQASASRSLQMHRLALSNFTGEAYFNRGGQVTGSLGTRGCDLSGIFPQQVGPPSQYAKTIQHWIHVILVLQVTACVLRGVVLLDLLGCIWMVLLCGVGYYAWYHEMHITYISLWGAVCALGTLLDILGFIIPVATGLIKLELLSTVVRIGTPCTELLGALLAWHLYRDYQVSRGEQPFGSFDPLGRTFEGWDPESNPILKGLSAAGFTAEKKYQEQYGSSNPFETVVADPWKTAPTHSPKKQNSGCC
ncbi:Titin [Durusdinium trenchii]|uniref:Titin n=2 Tax=Durusdinium trenchii TaxID=1381693 RepID=A0ABP0RPL0_9DINO